MGALFPFSILFFKTIVRIIIPAFQVACDSMNKGFQSYIHRHRALRLASIMVAPWFLPADIVYNYTLRYLQFDQYNGIDYNLQNCILNCLISQNYNV